MNKEDNGDEYVFFSSSEYYETLTPREIWKSLHTHREIMKNILVRLEALEIRMKRAEASL